MSRQDFLPAAHLCDATQFCYVVTRLLFLVLESFSRHGKVCRDMEKFVATLFICVKLISMLRP